MRKMLRNRLVPVLCLALIFVLMTACGKKNTSETPTPTAEPSEPTATPTEELSPTPTEGLSEKEIWYNKMIEDSLMSDGNNARLLRVIEKARSGEDVYIATIGGSITEGAGTSDYKDCYAASFAAAFAEEFGKDGGSNVHFVNAGLSGTPSTLGVLRYQRDVIAKNDGHKPDLLIVEFAVNDADDPTNGQTYEGIVRHALNEDNEPAVILLFSVFKSRWNLQDRLKPIGQYYDLPMVSIKDAVVPRLEDKSLREALYFSDEYHPAIYGHRIMKDCLMYLVRTIAAQEKEAAVAVPEKALLSDAFDNVVMVGADTEGVKLTAGGFKSVDKAVFSTKFENVVCFPENWKHGAADGDESFKLTAECRSIILTYKKSAAATFGKAEILVDGKVVKTVSGQEAGGWNNPYSLVILNDTACAEHTVEVRMAEGEKDKEFTILAIGVGK
jgi:hypothetical protein